MPLNPYNQLPCCKVPTSAHLISRFASIPLAGIVIELQYSVAQEQRRRGLQPAGHDEKRVYGTDGDTSLPRFGFFKRGSWGPVSACGLKLNVLFRAPLRRS